MRKFLPVALLLIPAVSGAMPTISMAAADPVPCEKMLSDLRIEIDSATLSDADKAKVADLEKQGIERCKADDDAGADALFSDAMKLMGK